MPVLLERFPLRHQRASEDLVFVWGSRVQISGNKNIPQGGDISLGR